MTLAYWSALLVGAIGAGIAVCASLVVRDRHVRWLALAAVLLAVMSGTGIALVARDTSRLDAMIAAAFISVGGFAGGFALAAALVPSLTRPAADPATVPAASGARDARRLSFVIVADGQPEHYEPAVLTEAYELLARSDAPGPPDAVRVFAYMAERLRYRSAGLSPSRPVIRALNQRVRERIRGGGFDGDVDEAWLQGAPRLADTVARLASGGASDIVIASVAVATSVPFDQARVRAEAVVPPASAVRLWYAHPLWADDGLAHLVVDRVLSALPGGTRQTDGVVLVAPGQPWQWDRESPASCEHQTFFLQRVRALLTAAGATESAVRIAWLDWQDPGVTEVVRHLAALGCERIVVVPATWPADTLETLIDLPNAVEAADLDPGITVEVLHGWGDEDAVAEAVARGAIAAAREAMAYPV